MQTHCPNIAFVNKQVCSLNGTGLLLGRPKTIRATASDVARLRAAGRSFRQVARDLGISLSSVQRLGAS
jgi:hypothetical protein